MCILQNPSAAFLHFYCIPCTIFFAGFELQTSQNRDGMPSPVHFFTSKPVSGINMRDQRLLCDSSDAALTSLSPARKEVRDKRRLLSTREEKVKREIFWVTHFFNWPYWLPQWYWYVSVNFTKWIMHVFRFINCFCFCTHGSSHSIFLQDRFHFDELHLFEAYSIGNYTLSTIKELGKFGSESEGEIL